MEGIEHTETKLYDLSDTIIGQIADYVEKNDVFLMMGKVISKKYARSVTVCRDMKVRNYIKTLANLRLFMIDVSKSSEPSDIIPEKIAECRGKQRRDAIMAGFITTELLPQTLTSLEIALTTSKFKGETQVLPPNLTSLSVIESLSTKYLATFAPNLVSLSAWTVLKTEGFSIPNIKVLKLHNLNDEDIIPEGIEVLETFTIGRIDYPCLTTLKMKELSTKLPWNITSLSVVVPPFIDDLHENLKALTIDHAIDIHGYVEKLPKSLQYLKAKIDCPFGITIPELRVNLTKHGEFEKSPARSVRFMSRPKYQTLYNISLFSPNLVSLRIDGGYDGSLDPITEMVSLKKLRLDRILVPQFFYKHIPRGLEILAMTSKRCKGKETEHYGTLPPNMTNLRLAISGSNSLLDIELIRCLLSILPSLSKVFVNAHQHDKLEIDQL